MFLSVSQLRFKQIRFKQTGSATLTLALLMLSLSAQAGLPEVAEQVADKAQSDMPPAKSSAQNQMLDVRAPVSNYPRWPQHRQGNKMIIPPPPPGPYNSSALSDYSVAVPVHQTSRPAPRRTSNYKGSAKGSPAVPMATFSPDRPWPKNLRPAPPQPNHRVSGQGSHPVQPPSTPLYAPMGNRSYGRSQKAYPGSYRNTPRMNAPRLNTPRMDSMGMNSSRWMPNMTMTPSGPYNNQLNYAPNYRSNYGSQYYGRPKINNNATRSANPAYR